MPEQSITTSASMSSSLPSGRVIVTPRTRAVFAPESGFGPAADEGGATRLGFFEHHGVKITSRDLPGRRRLNFPVFVPARDRNEPAARPENTHAVLHRIIALQHLFFQSETAQKRTGFTGHGFADVKARKLFLLENESA